MKQRMNYHKCSIMSKRHNILRIRTSSSLSNAGKIKSVQELNIKLSSHFIANDSHVYIICCPYVVFSECAMLHF